MYQSQISGRSRAVLIEKLSSSLTMIWSIRLMPIPESDCATRLVAETSAEDARRTPCGWQCARTILQHCVRIALLTINLRSNSTESEPPFAIFDSPIRLSVWSKNRT